MIQIILTYLLNTLVIVAFVRSLFRYAKTYIVPVTEPNIESSEEKNIFLFSKSADILIICFAFVFFFFSINDSVFFPNYSAYPYKNQINGQTGLTSGDFGSVEHHSSSSKDEPLESINPNSPNSYIEILEPYQIKTLFKDVAGLDEQKEEVQDLIYYLKDPKQFRKLGAKPPKGLLMYGPPGTGKTLLARAMAGEANVTFLSVSGSQFEEQYIGVGAARVRQLFAVANKHAPCVLFIDEIDTVASRRDKHDTSSGAQTVNQLLTELDGLNQDKNADILVIGASNRLESIDSAILRPGRFDRKVYLSLPSQKDREKILHVHMRNVKMSSAVDVNKLAKVTSGFSGADLAHFVNEAAIYATRHGKTDVDHESLEFAKDKISLGLEHKSRSFSEMERKITAYHEAGHAIVGLVLDGTLGPLYKVTISPRGPTLGVTSFEENERTLESHKNLDNNICVLLAGRIAEEQIFGALNATTGAENDFEKATYIAKNMVLKWGFSKTYPYMSASVSSDIINKEDAMSEVQDIIIKNADKTKKILSTHKSELDKLAKALLEKETLTREEVKKIIGL